MNDEPFFCALKNMDKSINDFDVQLAKNNKITDNITPEEADSWDKEDDYNELDYDFSYKKSLLKHPKLPTKLED